MWLGFVIDKVGQTTVNKLEKKKKAKIHIHS